MVRKIIALSCLSVCLLLINFAEARQLITKDSLAVYLDDNYQCGENITLTIKAPNQDVFKGDKVEVQRLVGSARAVLGFECTLFKQINVEGFVEKKIVYKATSMAKNNWAIVEVDRPYGQVQYGEDLRYKINGLNDKIDRDLDETNSGLDKLGSELDSTINELERMGPQIEEMKRKAMDGKKRALVDLANAYTNANQHEKAISALEEYLELADSEKSREFGYQQKSINYEKLALTHEESGEYEKAIEYWSKYINMQYKLKSPTAYIRYGSISTNYEKLKNFEKAIEYKNKDIAGQLEHKGVVIVFEYAKLAQYYANAGRYKNAIDSWNKYIDSDSPNKVFKSKKLILNAHILLSVCYARTQNYGKAIETMEKYMTIATNEEERDRGLKAIELIQRLKKING